MSATSTSLIVAFVFGIAFTASLVILQFLYQRAIDQSLKNLDLIPNCLLTRHPILFVSGRRSLFYFSNYWNRVPRFLTEHGYQIFELELPWRNEDQRRLVLREGLEAFEGRVHLIADVSSQNAILQAPPNLQAKIASVTFTPQIQSLAPQAPILIWQDFATPLTLLRRIMLGLHSLIFAENQMTAAQVGLPRRWQEWPSEIAFLQHAISLAENDLQCSHREYGNHNSSPEHSSLPRSKALDERVLPNS